MAHHATRNDDGSVALHAAKVLIDAGHTYAVIRSIIAVAAAIHVAVCDAGELSVCVGLSVGQWNLVADGATIDDHGGVARPVGSFHHLTEVAAAIHVAFNEDLRRCRAACQHQSQQEESSFSSQSILMSNM